jgi:hypothetical protein
MLDSRISRAESWHKDTAIRAKITRPPQPITCPTFAQDVLEGRASVNQKHEHIHQPVFGPLSLVGQPVTTERQRIAGQVFQPSHRLVVQSHEKVLKDCLQYSTLEFH